MEKYTTMMIAEILYGKNQNCKILRDINLKIKPKMLEKDFEKIFKKEKYGIAPDGFRHYLYVMPQEVFIFILMSHRGTWNLKEKTNYIKKLLNT